MEESIGIYDYSYRFAVFAVFLGNALSAPLRRQLARIFSGSIDVPLEGLLSAANRALSVISSSFVFFALYGAPFLFSYMVEPRFSAQATQIVRVLSLYVTISFFSVPLGEWLLTHKPHREMLRLSAFAGAANISVNFAMVPFLGVLGAALAKMAAEIVMLIYLVLKVPRQFMGGIRAPVVLGLFQLPWLLSSIFGVYIDWRLIPLHVLLTLAVMWRLAYFEKGWIQLIMRH